MVSSMVLVIDEAAGTEYHRFQTTFFNLKRASQREKSYTTAPHRNISVMHFFCSAQRWVHWRRENNNNFSLGPAVQDILIIHSIREKCLPLKLYSSTQPMLSPIPVTPPPSQHHKHTRTHSKWELTPSKGMVSYMRGPHFLPQPQPPQTKEAVSSFGN